MEPTLTRGRVYIFPRQFPLSAWARRPAQASYGKRLPRLLKERHLKFAFRQEGRVLRGIAWRASDRESFAAEHRAAIDLAFSLEQDNWNGERYMQLSVADFKASES